MLEDLKNEFTRKTKEVFFQRQAKDIFEDDKLLQTEKRLQKYMDTCLNGYNFFIFSSLPFFYSIFCIYSYIELEGGIFLLLLGILLALVAIYLCYFGYQRFPRYKRLPLYISSIADSKNGSIDNISDSLGYPYEMVISDIEFLIQKNILEKTYVNKTKRRITSPLVGEAILKYSVTQKCPNCGASITFIGQSTECDYCGSFLT